MSGQKVSGLKCDPDRISLSLTSNRTAYASCYPRLEHSTEFIVPKPFLWICFLCVSNSMNV